MPVEPTIITTDDEFDWLANHERRLAVDMMGAEPCVRPYGAIAYARPMLESLPLIPREQWQDLIAQKDTDASWMEDKLVGELPPSDQNGLPYCHGFGTVHGMMMDRGLRGLPYVKLSGTIIGGLTTGWRRQGADPMEDLRVLMEHGTCDEALLDSPYSLSPFQFKPEWKDECANHRCIEAADGRVPGKYFDAAMTAVLSDLPAPAWFTWWSHHIAGAIRAGYDAKTRQFWLRNWNNWGHNTEFPQFYEGRKGTPSGLLIIRTSTWSQT